MVIKFKYKKINWEEYSYQYRELMKQSYINNKSKWQEILSKPEITFVCFCKDYFNCHRSLLSKYFQKLGAVYKGER